MNRLVTVVLVLMVFVALAACSSEEDGFTDRGDGGGSGGGGCETPVESGGLGSVEAAPDPLAFESIPETHIVTVEVKTSSLWTSIHVTGVESITSSFGIKQGDGETNVDIGGLEVFDLSQPERGGAQNQTLVIEIVAIVQKQGDTAAVEIRKGGSGTTVYTLYEGGGSSATEVAQFVNRSANDGDNLERSVLDLDTLTSPIDFPSGDERYLGPLFDTHAHLVGEKDQANTEARFSRLHITPDTAAQFFSVMDAEGIRGLIGFLPVIHEDFVGDDCYNTPYQTETSEVVREYPNRLVPFLYPYSHVGIPANDVGHGLPGLIDQHYRNSDVTFRGIGEIHTEYPQTDSYADMRLTDPAMLDLYDYAADNGLIVMIHPSLDALEDLQLALDHNRSVQFHIHGLVNSVARASIPALLERLFSHHPNVYYSIDAALMEGYSLLDSRIKTKEQFLENLQSPRMYYRMLASALAFWKPIIEAHPTRMMWGTDLYYWWHFEPDVIRDLVRFSRDFIGALDPQVQELFAYRNVVETLDLLQE